MIGIKSPQEITIMQEGGQKLASILSKLAASVQPGITTKDLDNIARQEIEAASGVPSFLGFDGYPASICVSINDEVVHGIPSERELAKGDLIGIDIGMQYKGFHTDTATTVGVGEIDPDKKRLLEVTKRSLAAGIAVAKPGIHLGDVQHAIQMVIEAANMGIIRDLTGHGIGRQLQEPPSIPNYGQPGTGTILREGMTIALEPMVSLGDWRINILADGWTIVTADGSPAAHFEHTIAITKDGSKILTQA